MQTFIDPHRSIEAVKKEQVGELIIMSRGELSFSFFWVNNLTELFSIYSVHKSYQRCFDYKVHALHEAETTLLKYLPFLVHIVESGISVAEDKYVITSFVCSL